MALSRHVVRLLAVMIVMIIAGLLPCGAQAHEGHHQAGGAIAEAVMSDSADVVDVVRSDQARMAQFAHYNHEQHGPRCGSRCCGTGMSCCSAMLSEPLKLSLPHRRIARVIFLAVLLHAEVHLETLPKPPRSFA